MNDLMQKLTEIFGEEGVLCADALPEKYLAGCDGKDYFLPEAVVYAKNEDQIKKLIDLAGQTNTPVVVTSSGGNSKTGASLPAVKGAVALDLSKMDRIISVYEPYRIAMIEPGVTYGQFDAFLKEHGLFAYMPLAPRAEKSVLASVLEVEPRIASNVQWSSFDPLRCAGVFWGDGNRFFTGEASAGVQDVEAQHKVGNWQHASGGPDAVDYIRFLVGAQGTMGVAFWVTVRCGMAPTLTIPKILASDQLFELTDFIYEMEHLRFTDTLLILNRADFARLIKAQLGKDIAEDTPEWILITAFTDRPIVPEARAKAHFAGAERVCEKLGIKFLDDIGGVSAEEALKAAGTPCGKGRYWKEVCGESFKTVQFLTTLDKAGAQIAAATAVLAKEGLDPSKLGTYIQPMLMGVNCRVELSLYLAKEDAENGTELVKKMDEALLEAGAYFSRPTPNEAVLLKEKGVSSYEVLTKLKGIFDPKGILNPGKLMQAGGAK